MYSFNSLNYANYARYLSNSRFDSTRFEGRSHHFCLSMQSRRLSSAVLDKIKLLRKLFSQHSSVKKETRKIGGTRSSKDARPRKGKESQTVLLLSVLNVLVSRSGVLTSVIRIPVVEIELIIYRCPVELPRVRTVGAVDDYFVDV